MTNPTKKELLATATEMKIVGRHDMNREELEAAIAAREAETKVQAEHDAFVGNYIPTSPFRGRPYTYISTNEEAYVKLPPQAKAIFNHMRDTRITARGDQIIASAVDAGVLKTTQSHAILFAFYARKLEEAGIRLAQ